MASCGANQPGCRAIFLTGPPAIGKTTLIKNVISLFKNEKISYHGFFTEEVRRQGYRVGFDAVSISSDGVECVVPRAALARVDQSELRVATADRATNWPKVGKYLVDVGSFEDLMTTALNPSLVAKRPTVVVIDEIGKMELFSHKFKDVVNSKLSDQESLVLATVPIKPNSFVDQLRSKYKVKVITVSHSNRDRLHQEICNTIKQMLN